MAAGFAIAVALATAAPASATTFCVPSFHAACPNAGGNVASPTLGSAMQTNGDDGAADTVIVAPGVVSQAAGYAILSGDNDPLEIVGAGPSQTVITTTQSGNQFVMNLNGARDVTMRDLAIRVPATMNDNQGGALQTEQDTFRNVHLQSANVRSDGINSAIGGSTFEDGAVYGVDGGSIDTAFSGNGAGTGSLEIRRTQILEPSWGIASDDPEVTVIARRVLITDPLAYGFRVTDGSFGRLENSIIAGVDTGYAIIAESNDPGVVLPAIRHVTISGNNPANPAITARVQNAAGNGLINMVVRDVIIRGYPNPLWCEAPVSGSIGNANLSINYSWFFHSANVIGDCSLSNTGTIDSFAVGEPQFAGPGDFHLPAGSPAIDSGDPQVAAVTAEDYDGNFRPNDGNGNGQARRDMGAYEFQPTGPGDPGASDGPPQGSGGDISTPGGDDVPPPDQPSEAPRILKLRFKRGFSESDGGTIKLKLSEAAAVALKFRARKGGKRGKKGVALAYNGVAGANKLRVKRGRLDAGAYRVKATATDLDGLRSKPAKARVKVGD